MAQEPEDAEALRRRLYRPGASDADLSSYLQATTPEGPAGSAPPAEPERRPPVRPFVVGAIAVGCAALLGGLLLSGALTPSRAAPGVAAATPSSAATASFQAGGNQVEFVTTTVLDGGSAPHARGAAVQEGPDRYRYTVAAGDTVDGVGGRFGVCAGDVLVALPYGTDPARLPADQTVEIAKLTSTTC